MLTETVLLPVQIVSDTLTYLEENADKRSTNWPLMSSPFPTILIIVAYIYIVKILGPKLMKNREPYKLKNTLIVYNLFQVLFNIWILKEGLIAGWLFKYSFICQPIDKSPTGLHMAAVCWYYYISKLIDLVDTIFFVMRKKYNQVTFLHIYHHASLPILCWLGTKLIPGGHCTFFGLLNTTLHVIMYTYYLLSVFGPSMEKYLWWKKYLTTLQIIQFVLVVIHSFQMLYFKCDNLPIFLVHWLILQASVFFVLFINYYVQTFKVNKKKEKAS